MTVETDTAAVTANITKLRLKPESKSFSNTFVESRGSVVSKLTDVLRREFNRIYYRFFEVFVTK